MEGLLQILTSGIAMGFIYALVGYEFTLIWNSASLINFGHDKFIMLSAYIFAGTFIVNLKMDPALAIILTMFIMGLFGALAAMGIFNPLRNMPSDIFAVMGTILLARIIGEFCRLVWGPIPFTVHNFLDGTIKIGSVTLAQSYIAIIVLSIAVFVFLQIFFKKTKAGMALRCVSQNKTAAALMGIHVSKSITLSVMLSSIICTLIGVLIIPTFMVNSNMASTIGLKGFSAGVMGGFGSLPGCIVGGLLIGVIENLSSYVIPAVYKDIIAFALMILFLLVKPTGILGRSRE